jgi:hypothetical protein
VTCVRLDQHDRIEKVYLSWDQGSEVLQIRAVPRDPAQEPQTLDLHWGDALRVMTAGMQAVSRELDQAHRSTSRLADQLAKWVKEG